MPFMDLVIGSLDDSSRAARNFAGARAHSLSEPLVFSLVYLDSEGFSSAKELAQSLRHQFALPVLVRLTSQPIPELEQLNQLHDAHIPFISVPDRLVRDEGDRAEARLKRELTSSLKAFLNAHLTWFTATQADSSHTQAAVEPDDRDGLSDEERQEYLRTMSGQGQVDDSVR